MGGMVWFFVVLFVFAAVRNPSAGLPEVLGILALARALVHVWFFAFKQEFGDGWHTKSGSSGRRISSVDGAPPGARRYSDAFLPPTRTEIY
jgi:hypothetical protein